MITSLYLEGFKSFGKPVTIDFRDITLLYGENSSGKSTILQALQYAREVFCNGNLDCLKTEIGGDFVDLRGFDNFVHGRDKNKAAIIGVSVCLDTGKKKLIPTINFGQAGGLIDGLDWIGGMPLHKELSESIDDAWIAMQDSGNNGDFVLWHEVPPREVAIVIKIMRLSQGEDLAITQVRFVVDGEELLCSETLKDFSNANQTACPPTRQLVKINTAHEQIPDCVQPLSGCSDWEGHSPPPCRRMKHWRRRVSALCGSPSIQWTVDGDDILTSIVNGSRRLQLDAIGNLLLLNPKKTHVYWEVEETDIESPYQDNNFKRKLRKSDLKDIAVPSVFAGLFAALAIQTIENALYSIQYIGPLRSHYSPPHRILAKGELRSWADGLGAWDHLGADPSLTSIVNGWLTNKKLFGFECEIDTLIGLRSKFDDLLAKVDSRLVDELRQIVSDMSDIDQVIIKSPDGYRLNSTDVGVGFSQVLPIIVAARGPQPACILLEQPELHIHVRLQAVLGDLLATGIEAGAAPEKRRQFIVETHSEALLLRLMRRIRETTKEIVNNGPRLQCDHVAIYHISKQDGNSIAKKIELDTYGNLTDEWPDDLFEMSYKERFGE